MAHRPDNRSSQRYVSDASGALEVYVSPFPDATVAPAMQISVGGGGQPRWRSDGEAILYVSADSRLTEVSLTPGSGSGLEAGVPELLFELPPSVAGLNEDRSGWFWDMTLDGERFLISSAPLPGAPPLIIESDWRTRLEGKQR